MNLKVGHKLSHKGDSDKIICHYNWIHVFSLANKISNPEYLDI